MKFLRYRNDFLTEESKLIDQTNSSLLINEYLQNDIRFGDSYFGRLVNSSLQMLRTAYKTIRIPFILNNLEDQLQTMIDRIKFEQVTKDYPTLFLKATLEELKSCCMSTLSDEEKLKILIGWDGTFEAYDPKDPIGDIPNYYVDRKIVVPCLAQNAYNKLADAQFRERLEKAFNKKITKSYLDLISNFIDGLRKLSYQISNPGTPTPSGMSGPQPFNLNLLSVLQKIVNMNLVVDNFKFKSYLRFINEDVESNDVSNLNKLQKISTELMGELKNVSPEQVLDSDKFKEFVKIYKNLNNYELEILRKNDVESDIQNLIGEQTAELTDQEPPQQVKEPEEQKVVDQKEPIQQKLTTVTSTKVPTFTEPTSTSDVSLKQKEEPKEDDDAETDEDENEKDPNFNPKQPLAENSKYLNYIMLTLENTIVGTPPPPSGSSQSISPSTNQPTTSSGQSADTVKTLWQKFFDGVDKILPAKMTQEDIDKLKGFSTDEVDIAFAMSQEPDPIIKIVKLFETANGIYTTPYIPSGRENGEVWSVTFRRYRFVGQGSPGTPKSPGYGPWVHMPLFNQWKRGVLTLMSKPQFKEIFKNVRSLVETFDKNLTEFDRIVEKDDLSTDKQSLEPSKILQEFMLDMLKLKNQADFDVYSSKALSRFWGINIDSDKLKSAKNVSVQDIPIDEKDIDANSFVWAPFKQTSFSQNDIDKLFAFPIEDLRKNQTSKHQVIFLRPFNINGDKVEVKFTYDNQGESDLIMESSKYNGGKKVNWSCDNKSFTSTNNVYYGVMKNDFTNGIQLCYANVSNSLNFRYEATLFGEPKSTGQSIFRFSNNKIKLDSGQTKILYPAKLVYYDQTKNKIEPIFNSNTTLNKEVYDEKLKKLKVSGSSGTLYDELINKGKKEYNWT